MSHAIDMDWFMLKKYYAKSDTVPAYAAALLLDPRKHIAYLTKNWPEEWISGILKNVKGLWHEEYGKDPNELARACFMAIDLVPKKPRVLSRFEVIRNRLEVAQAQNEDNFTSFINEPAIKLLKGMTPL
jgi:hypothetical protein